MNYSTLLRMTVPSRGRLCLIAVLLLLGSALSLANPWMAGILTKSVLNPGAAGPTFQQVLSFWFLLLIGKAILGFATSFQAGKTSSEVDAALRIRVYEHLQSLPLKFHHQNSPGESLTLLSKDASILSEFVTNTLVQILPLLATFIGAAIIMAWLDLRLALLALLLLPVYYLAMKLIGRRLRPLASEWIESWASLISLAQENLSLIPLIKAFVREPVESKRFGEQNTQVKRLTQQQLLIHSALTPTIGLMAGAGLLIILWLGIRRIEAGMLEPAALVSLLLYTMLLTQPVGRLANVYGQIMRTRGAADRLIELFGQAPEPLAEGLPEIGTLKGEIELRDVGFAYPGCKPALNNFNLRIRAGETVILAGENGVGKTTLAHLLLRFMDPDQGQILYDGKDVREYSLTSLRQQIGLVAQHTLLVNASVADNIAYGQESASLTSIEESARLAGAIEFIEKLPHGFNTLIGDQGIRLSGGQRQRLALARTLLKNPPILILDEATSMVDQESERKFFSHCRTYFADRTVLLISHDPSKFDFADRIVTIPNQERQESRHSEGVAR